MLVNNIRNFENDEIFSENVSQENNLLNDYTTKMSLGLFGRTWWRFSNYLFYSTQGELKELHQTCSAPCIYQTILEPSDYSGIYIKLLQKECKLSTHCECNTKTKQESSATFIACTYEKSFSQQSRVYRHHKLLSYQIEVESKSLADASRDDTFQSKCIQTFLSNIIWGCMYVLRSKSELGRQVKVS